MLNLLQLFLQNSGLLSILVYTIQLYMVVLDSSCKSCGNEAIWHINHLSQQLYTALESEENFRVLTTLLLTEVIYHQISVISKLFKFHDFQYILSMLVFSL
jgi:hypothetical protein